MVTVPSSIVAPALRLIRANRTFVSADEARRHVRRRELRPTRYGPPRQLHPDVRVDIEHRDGWPVYTIRPRNGSPTGSLVYVHGGGWVNQIVLQHWQLAAQIAAEANTTVTVPIYPLVPFGTAAEVASYLVDLVRHNIASYGSTSIGGDSAGGQISLSVALALRDEHGITLPRTVLISPALDLTWDNPMIPVVQPTDPWLATPGGKVFAEYWRGDRDLRDPVVSPLFGDLAGLGPITLFSGTRDVLNPDARLLVDKAAASGVGLDFHERPGQLHVYPLLPTMVGREARAIIVSRIRSAQAD
ncbi:alpha/beta hydrolase fold domain-containing protein [Agreia sp. COWG]|uniref:alpha/beta hydrolase fold domain-containing protein n=1 Tax=Agreia sp. COWG TaxID=2773266 RepID=UPI0019272AF7|nr:alpha/beta hydrolase [Agreia sp. COWG]CAD6009140.1 Acetyl esterase/lipase [Agreia sp. COWG]